MLYGSGLLAGQTALVTGASKGIGKGIALALATAGANVAVNYHSDANGARLVAEEIRKMGRAVAIVHADVGDAAAVDLMFEQVAEALAPPSILVNNAGVQTWKPLLELSETEWNHVLNTNLRGCFLCTQRAARQMQRSGGGVIVNLGSGCNKVPFPKLVDYTASKGGIEMFTKVAAVELGNYGVRVNCVAPGAIEIERTAHEQGTNFAETWSAIAPLGRIGLPEDVAHLIVFLCSNFATYITGQTIWVDGGAFTRPMWPYS